MRSLCRCLLCGRFGWLDSGCRCALERPIALALQPFLLTHRVFLGRFFVHRFVCVVPVTAGVPLSNFSCGESQYTTTEVNRPTFKPFNSERHATGRECDGQAQDAGAPSRQRVARQVRCAYVIPLYPLRSSPLHLTVLPHIDTALLQCQ